MNEIKSRLKECIIERLDLEIESSEIDDTVSLFEQDLDIDSLDSLELVIAVGKEFGVQIGDDDVEVIKSIDSLSEYIEKNMK